MLKSSELAPFLDIPVEVDAILNGLILRVGELLALEPGRVVASALPAGGSVDVTAGGAVIGKGELTVSGGHVAVRMLEFRERE